MYTLIGEKDTTVVFLQDMRMKNITAVVPNSKLREANKKASQAAKATCTIICLCER